MPPRTRAIPARRRGRRDGPVGARCSGVGGADGLAGATGAWVPKTVGARTGAGTADWTGAGGRAVGVAAPKAGSGDGRGAATGTGTGAGIGTGAGPGGGAGGGGSAGPGGGGAPTHPPP